MMEGDEEIVILLAGDKKAATLSLGVNIKSGYSYDAFEEYEKCAERKIGAKVCSGPLYLHRVFNQQTCHSKI